MEMKGKEFLSEELLAHLLLAPESFPEISCGLQLLTSSPRNHHLHVDFLPNTKK
jgi:hypothetical protein